MVGRISAKHIVSTYIKKRDQGVNTEQQTTTTKRRVVGYLYVVVFTKKNIQLTIRVLWGFLKDLADIILVKEWGGEGLGGRGGFSPSGAGAETSPSRSASRLGLPVSEDSKTEGRRLLVGRGRECV